MEENIYKMEKWNNNNNYEIKIKPGIRYLIYIATSMKQLNMN